jgi:nitrogen regulatory protein PII
MANTVNESGIKKQKLLFTVVDRAKAEFYLDVLSQFDVNCQMVTSGKGTAQSELIDLLGLNIHKAVILSVVREDMVDPVMKCLEDKFATIRNGKGIAFAVPLSSVIGVNIYQFLSNNKQGREESL